MKKFILIFFITITCQAQKNSVYAEIYLEAVTAAMSINYERQLFNNSNLLIRAGVGLYQTIGIFGISDGYYTVPVTFHYLAPVSDNSFVDIGIDPTFNTPGSPKNIVYLFTNIGFRKNIKNNLFWRVHVTPYTINLTKKRYSLGDEFISIVEEFNLPRTWAGFSIGKRF